MKVHIKKEKSMNELNLLRKNSIGVIEPSGTSGDNAPYLGIYMMKNGVYEGFLNFGKATSIAEIAWHINELYLKLDVPIFINTLGGGRYIVDMLLDYGFRFINNEEENEKGSKDYDGYTVLKYALVDTNAAE